MNRIYKVIWNEALSCFTAVGEYAKTGGKSSKSSVNANATINTTSNLSSNNAFRLTAIGLGLLAAGFSLQVNAASCNGSTTVECGTNATASMDHGIAIGKNATASGGQGIAIGGGSNGEYTTASGQQSIAIGANVVSSGDASIAIGGDDLDDASEYSINEIFKGYTGSNIIEDEYNRYDGHTESKGAASVAIGVKARSEGNLSTTVGVRSSSSGAASSAFGMGASASRDGSVALGAGSTTLTDATKETTMSVGGVSYSVAGSAQRVGDQVSVGSLGRERQIKHVAAGAVNANSTDAINGSQLHATNTTIADNKTKYYSVKS
ncbi:MAG TPA: ESPR-type extended signal peptide-containing protein, partial [Psychrobacter sp.]|uniref:ESPR domain-containing protein n=1 Tax=Psychrobacter sp. TaxID=56811 RepID=UPI002CC116C2